MEVSGQADALVALSRRRSSGTQRLLGGLQHQLGHLEKEIFFASVGILTSGRPACKVAISVHIFMVTSSTVTN